MAHRTYRYFDGPVLFPFGFGLSYSSFIYKDLRLDHSTIHAGDPVTATVTLTDTGTRPGDEVAQLYLTPPQQPGSPRLTLQGVQRAHLAPGESRTITFALAPAQLSFVDPTGHRAIRPGDYRLTIGGSQPTAGQPSVILHITGEKPADF
jgi:beta-glucosidase